MDERGAISDEIKMMSHGSVMPNDVDNFIAWIPTPFKMRVVALSFATDGDISNTTTPVSDVKFLPLKKVNFDSIPVGADAGGTDDEMHFRNMPAWADGSGTFTNMLVVEAGERWGIEYSRYVKPGQEVFNEISVQIFCEQL